MGILLIVCFVYLVHAWLITKDYVIPSTSSMIYGKELEKTFNSDQKEVDGEVQWKHCQRDEDNNIIITMTEKQR